MMERDAGLVTTIIPVHNRAAMLHEAVASVLAQTYRPIEILIVDDASTDDTANMADDLARSHREVQVIHLDINRGTGLAREAARQLARGEFLQHLDSDDLLLPRKFDLQVGALRANPDAGVAYGWTRLRREDGRLEPRPWKESGIRRDRMFPSFLRSRWWDTPTPLYRASGCDAAGPWSDLRLEEDWEYDCRIAALGTRLAFVEDWVAEVREHPGSKLGRGAAFDAERLSERARSHEMIFQNARAAKIDHSVPEMQHFARELFLLSRQCGAAGLVDESRRLFELARMASGPRASGLDFRSYSLLAHILGWKVTGRLACWSDLFRPGSASRAEQDDADRPLETS